MAALALHTFPGVNSSVAYLPGLWYAFGPFCNAVLEKTMSRVGEWVAVCAGCAKASVFHSHLLPIAASGDGQ